MLTTRRSPAFVLATALGLALAAVPAFAGEPEPFTEERAHKEDGGDYSIGTTTTATIVGRKTWGAEPPNKGPGLSYVEYDKAKRLRDQLVITVHHTVGTTTSRDSRSATRSLSLARPAAPRPTLPTTFTLIATGRSTRHARLASRAPTARTTTATTWA